MGNCLVTKLKDVVNNPELVGINGFRFDIKAEVSEDTVYTNMCHFGTNVNVKFISGNLTAIDGLGNQYTSDVDNIDLYYFRGTGVVEISNKYNFSQILVGSMVNPVSDVINWINYCSDVVRSVQIRSTRFNQKVASQSVINSNITTLLLENTKAFGEVNEYVHSLPNIENFNIYETSITGAIEDLSGFSRLKTTALGYIFASSDLKDLVLAYRAKGITENAIGIKLENTEIKFNGNTIPYFSAQKTLTWTQTTITFDGTTINV